MKWGRLLSGPGYLETAGVKGSFQTPLPERPSQWEDTDSQRPPCQFRRKMFGSIEYRRWQPISADSASTGMSFEGETLRASCRSLGVRNQVSLRRNVPFNLADYARAWWGGGGDGLPPLPARQERRLRTRLFWDWPTQQEYCSTKQTPKKGVVECCVYVAFRP